MTDDTPMNPTPEERARVEARHVVEALAKVLKSVRTPVDFPILYVWSDAEDLARAALAFARARVPSEDELMRVLLSTYQVAPTKIVRANARSIRAEMLARLGGEEG